MVPSGGVSLATVGDAIEGGVGCVMIPGKYISKL